MALESERLLLPTDGIDVRERLLALVEQVEKDDPAARSEVKSLLARLIARIDCVRADWPEWENRKSGTLDGLLPDWGQELLDKAFTIFAECGPHDRLMIAIQMRNGSRIAVMRSKYTILLLRPAEVGKSSNVKEWDGVVVRA